MNSISARFWIIVVRKEARHPFQNRSPKEYRVAEPGPIIECQCAGRHMY